MTCPTCGHPQLTERPHVHPLGPPPQADAAAREVWAELERLAGFSERIASAWRSCLVRAGLLALALILVGLAAALMGRAT